ncbi:MAG: hypothetical protein AAF921_04820 [Cyanobacteria bacterium P01_D01_bin.44]
MRPSALSAASDAILFNHLAAIAGPLADTVFEPAMQSKGGLANSLGSLFGTGTGAGIAVQMTLFASGGVLLSFGGYKIRELRAALEASDREPL